MLCHHNAAHGGGNVSRCRKEKKQREHDESQEAGLGKKQEQAEWCNFRIRAIVAQRTSINPP